MQKVVAVVLLLLVTVLIPTCEQPPSAPPTPIIDRATAIAAAQRLHDELNRLEIANLIDEQARYFSEDVVRLDPNRTPQRGRDVFLDYARRVRASGYALESATTDVMDAWVEGNRMVEYGTTLLKGRFGEAASGDDPVNYLAVWRVNPANLDDAQIETIIWNTQKPMPGLGTASTVTQ